MSHDDQQPHCSSQRFTTPTGHIKCLEKLHNSAPGYRRISSKCIDGSKTPYTPKSEHLGRNNESTPLNPFDHNLLDKLNHPMFSPNVFARVVDPNDSEAESPGGFHWTIDQRAMLHPADIDEMPVLQHIHDSRIDHDREKYAQEAIKRYFQSNVIAPSPWNNEKELPTDLHQQPSTPFTTEETYFKGNTGINVSAKKSVSCQTSLSLPIDFDLEKVLGGEYFNEASTVEENALQDISLCSLRRKLFFHGERGPSPVKNVNSTNLTLDPLDDDLSPSDNTCVNDISTRVPISGHFSSSPIGTKRSHGPINFSAQLQSPIKSSSFDDSFAFGTPNICPMQATPSTDRNVRRVSCTKNMNLFGSPDISPINFGRSGRLQATPSTQEKQKGFHLIDSPEMSPIHISRSPGITPDYSSDGHQSNNRSVNLSHRFGRSSSSSGRRKKSVTVQQKLTFTEDSDDSPKNDLHRLTNSPITENFDTSIIGNLDYDEGMNDQSELFKASKLSDIKEVSSNDNTASFNEMDNQGLVSTTDVDITSQNTTGYHTRSCLLQESDEFSSMSILPDGKQSSTNLTNQFENLKMLNMSSKIDNAGGENGSNGPSFAGIFNKEPAAEDILDMSRAAELSNTSVDDTGLGLELDLPDSSNNSSIIKTDFVKDEKRKSNPESNLDDSLMRVNMWQTSRKKRIFSEHYNGSATWPPTRSTKSVNCLKQDNQTEHVLKEASERLHHYSLEAHPS